MNQNELLALDSRWKIKFTHGAENTKIRYGIYGPSTGNINKFILLVNGRNEFIEKYSYVVQDLKLPPDCAVLTWDHRGQGESSGQTSHCESYEHFAEDARIIITQENPAPDK